MKCAIEYDGDESHFNDEKTKKNDLKKNKLSFFLDVNLLRIIPFDYTNDIGWNIVDKVFEAVDYFFLYLDLREKTTITKIKIYTYNPIEAERFDVSKYKSNRSLNNRALKIGAELFVPIKTFDIGLSFFLTQQIWGKYLKVKIIDIKNKKIEFSILTDPSPVTTKTYTVDINDLNDVKKYYKNDVLNQNIYSEDDNKIYMKNLNYSHTRINFHIDIYKPLSLYIQVKENNDIEHIYPPNNENVRVSKQNMDKNNQTFFMFAQGNERRRTEMETI
jgi:hypothetical protein